MNDRRLKAAVERELTDGPRSLEALLEAAHRQGLRKADLGDVWEVCQVYGLGELVDNRIVPPGWVAPTNDRQSRAAGPAAPRASSGGTALSAKAPQPGRADLPPAVRSEIEDLRRQLALTDLPQPAQTKTDPAWSRCVIGIKAALQQENAEASRQRVCQAIDLEGGVLISESRQQRILRFDAASDPNVAEGTTATLTVDGDDYDVEVISVFGSSITLAAASGTPVAASAKLGVDLSWLIRAQLRRTAELYDGGPGFNPATALSVLGELQPPPRRLTPATRSGLNENQNHALTQAVGDGVTWLWGPPGTGKTTTVAAVVAELLRRRQRVLLAAPTNAAVDVAFQAVLRQKPKRKLGELVRLGYPADTTLLDHTGGIVLVDEVAAVRGAPVATRLQEVNLETRQLRSELKTLKVRRTLSVAQSSQRDRIEIRLGELAALRSELHRLMKAVRTEVCLQARLVAATGHQVYLDTLKGITFDAVVLDEASMTTAALAALVAGTSTNRVLITGDFRQLPPVVRANTAEAADWLRQSPFERAGIPRSLESGHWPANLVALDVQHRMRPQISELVSEVFYPDSPLRVAESITRRPVPALPRWAKAEIQLIDTAGMDSPVMRRQGQYSRFNMPHAQLVAALLAPTSGFDVAVISPFAPQARLLSSLLPADDPTRAASTVHRFQGAEADVVIFDAVDTGRGVTRLHPWLAGGSLEDTGPRLINVAVSRARESLLLLADLSALTDPRRATGAPAKFLAALREVARPVAWHTLTTPGDSPTRLLSGEHGRQLLVEDLKAAGRAEIRCDPGDTPLLYALLADQLVLKALAALADRATVWMEPDKRGKLPAAALVAHKTGVNVRLATPVRGTVLVTDRCVWSTLPPGPDSDMPRLLRTAHPELAEATLRVLRRDHKVGPGSGQPQERCGRCGGYLLRREGTPRYGPRYGCPHCDGHR